MSSYFEKEQTRIKVVEYYRKVANRSKLKTVRHFKNVSKGTIYGILKRFEESGAIKNIKPPGCKPRPENVEKFRKYIELYKMDPQITLSEAAQILGMTKSTLHKYRKKLLAIAKSNSPSVTKVDTPHKMQCGEMDNDYETGQDQSEDIVAMTSTENCFVKQEFVNSKPQRKRSGTKTVSKEIDIQKRCLVCLESFQKRPSSDGKVMENNMTLVFVLKKLLNLSSEDLIKMMKNSQGRCPKDWTDFCEKCHDLVKKAVAIHGKIRKLEDKLAECGDEIIRNIKNSSGLKFKKICDKEKLFVEKRVRELVVKTETTTFQSRVNPFDEGDKKAKSLVQESSLEVKQEVVEPEIEFPEADFDMASDLDVNKIDTNNTDLIEPSTVPSSMPLENTKSNVNEGMVEAPPTPTPTLGVCDICGVQIRPLALPTHRLKEHGVVMEGYSLKKCTFQNCNYETLYDALLLAHQKKHKQTCRHACHVCGKTFKLKPYLLVHEGIHKNAETRPYQCEICGASFAVKNYLYLHTRLSHQGRYFPSTKRRRPKPQ